MLLRSPSVRQILLWLFLANLPAILLYTAIGLFHGFFDYTMKREWLFDKSVPIESTEVEAEVWRLLSDIATINAPPYGVPKIMTPTSWWKRLNLHPIDEDGKIGYRRELHFGNWYRKVEPEDSGMAWHHWVYLSGRSPASTAWNEAFTDLASYHSTNPAANNANFHHVSCQQSRLCGRWLVDPPALVHFTTETLDDEKQQIEVGSETYRKVAIRFVELGRDLDGSKDLKQVLFDQLQKLTHDGEAWKHFGHPHSEEEHFSRLRKLNHRIMERQHAHSYGRLKSLGAVVMPKLWPHVIFQQSWITRAAYDCSRRLVMVTRYSWDLFSALVTRSKRRCPSDDEGDKAKYASEARALELASTTLQCVDNEFEILQFAMPPKVWEMFDKLREILPEQHKRAMKEGKVRCDMDWP